MSGRRVNRGADISMTINLQVVAETDGLPSADELENWLGEVLRSTDSPPAEVTVRIVGEDESRELNARFRHKDKATNVLSFPAVTVPGLPARAAGTLGDLVICAPVVVREATEQGKAVRAHWAHMLVHGTLHLLGFDHLEEAEAQRMEGLERQILAGCGFADPYADSDA